MKLPFGRLMINTALLLALLTRAGALYASEAGLCLFAEALNDEGLIEREYRLDANAEIQYASFSFQLQRFLLKDNNQTLYTLPETFLIIESRGKQLRLPRGRLLVGDIRDYLVFPRTRVPLLTVPDPSGGNGWNANPSDVFSLHDDHFLERLGDVAEVKDVDADGWDELLCYEDVWESGLGWLGHSGAPKAYTVLKVDDGRIVPDREGYREHYRSRIAALDKEIRDALNPSDPCSDLQLLQRLLTRFLWYRVMGESEAAWSEFRRDTDRRTPELRIRQVGQRFEPVPLTEIEREMRRTLDLSVEQLHGGWGK